MRVAPNLAPPLAAPRASSRSSRTRPSLARASLVGAVLVSALIGCGGDTETIDPPPVGTPLSLTTTTLPNASLGVAYTQVLAAAGGTAPYVFSITAGALPTGVTLSGATLGGTPTVPGRASFTLTVTDAKGAAVSGALTLYVTPEALLVATSSLASGQEQQPYAADLLAEGGIAPYRWALTAGALPAGLVLDAAGSIEGTPSTAGTTAFTVEVTDAEDKTAALELMLTVRPLLPMITTTTLTRAVRGAEYEQIITVASGTPPYTWSTPMGMLPRGITLDATGRLSGRATVSGVYRFTVRVTDARMRTDEAQFGLVVLAPLAITTRTLPNALLNRPYTARVEASGGALPYRWDVSAGMLPMGITMDPTGLLSGTTAQAGDFPITVRVADDAGGVRQVQLTLSVADVLVYTSTPALAFPPVCDVPGNPRRCVPWTQGGGQAVCTSTQVSYQTVEIPVSESFAISSLTVGVDLDYSDAGLSYNTGNPVNDRNTRLRLLITGPDGRPATLCGNDNGHRQMSGCYGGQNEPNSVGGIQTTYPDNSAPVSTPLTVFNGTNAQGVWRFQVSVAWPTTDANGNCHQAGVINSVTLSFRADRSPDPYITVGGFAYNNLIHDPWVRIAGGNQVPGNNTIQLTATYWEVGPNGFREGGQGDDVPSSQPFTFTGVDLPRGTTVTSTGAVTGGDDTGDADVVIDDGAGHSVTRRLLIIPPDWNRKFRDF